MRPLLAAVVSTLFAAAAFAQAYPPSVPLNDLAGAPYAWGYFGGLYENGSNTMPADHLAAGMAEAAKVRPLDANGIASPDGKIGVVALGYASTGRIFCGDDPSACDAESFVGRVTSSGVADPHLVFVDGAVPNLDATNWIRPDQPTWDRVSAALAAKGVTESQVQVAWVQLATFYPFRPLPIQDSDAYRLKGSIAAALRAMKTRYPNLHLAYLSSREYGGYATNAWNPEPFAYESAFSVRWVVVAQEEFARTGGYYWDTRIGDVDLARGNVPWIGWGPYLWANGTTPRSDGLTWQRDDYEADGNTLSAAGAAKGAQLLLDFFLREPTARPWFLARDSTRRRATR